MKKTRKLTRVGSIGHLFKILRVMKVTLLMLFIAVIEVVAADVNAQNGMVSIALENKTIKDVLVNIEAQSDYSFFYNEGLIDVRRVVTINVKDEKIESVLIELFNGTDVSHEVRGNHIILSNQYMGSPAMLQQQLNVTGKVTDTKGIAIPGVSVLVKGTSKGTITDIDGNFSLSEVDSDDVLVFSFVGMVKQEAQVGQQTSFNIIMEDEAIGLDEVVAIGYGFQKKVNLTGSVETIEGESISKQPIVKVSQALAGLAPGLTAIQSSGQPGSGATLRIRGIGSIGASNDPLVLIDGVEGSIDGVDGNDVESISVLKDAASASIYGSRASNGVILITTKRAKNEDLTISYKNYFGIQNPTNLPKYLGALDFLKYSGESQDVIDNYAANMKSDPDNYPDTDWVDMVFSENGFQQYHSLSVSGGSEKAKMLASIGFNDQKGNIKNFDYKRYTGRFNGDFKFTDKFDINFDLSFRKSEQNSPTSGLNLIVRNAFRIPPIYSAVHSDGSWGDGWAGENPIAMINAGGNSRADSHYFRSILRANYSPIPELKFSLMYAPEYNDGYNKVFTRTYETIVDWDSKSTRSYPDRNGLSQTNGRTWTDNLNFLVTFDKAIEKHHFSALLGYEFIKDQYESFSASRNDYILQNYQVLNAGSEESDANSGSATHSGLVSYFGRINYSFNDRYLLEANLRRDASSRFATENRVGIFPSFSGAWRISEESFIKDLDIFSNLKLRASWGQLGNQQIGSDFPYTSTIVLGNTNYVFGNSVFTGASQGAMANPEIQWETTETTNLGLDAGFLNNRLSFSAELYERETKDILLNLPIPLVMGLSAPTQNAGNVKNSGFDFSLNWQDRVGAIKYGARFNISKVKNEVTNLAGIGPIISGNSIIEVGSPISLIYGYESVGIFQDEASLADAPAQFGNLVPGNIQYKDQLTIDSDGDGIADQADGIINPDDRVVLGNPFPTLTYGIDLNAAYKGFDVSVSLQGTGKRDVLLRGDLVWPTYNAGKIQEWQVDQFWSSSNTNAKFPAIAPTSYGSNDIQTSSTWVFDASYLRVRNITLGYTFPKQVLNRTFIKDLRLYFSGQNLFTFDNLPEGIDPLTPNNSEGAIYPITSSLTFGVDLKF